MSEYNYPTFDMAKEEAPFVRFGSRLHAGEQAPTFLLEDLDTGEPVDMAGLWSDGPGILEFGSFT